MARAHTKCTRCEDIIWFDDGDLAPQAVVCPCGATKLTESGPEGEFTALTQEEIDSLP